MVRFVVLPCDSKRIAKRIGCLFEGDAVLAEILNGLGIIPFKD